MIYKYFTPKRDYQRLIRKIVIDFVGPLFVGDPFCGGGAFCGGPLCGGGFLWGEGLFVGGPLGGPGTECATRTMVNPTL